MPAAHISVLKTTDPPIWPDLDRTAIVHDNLGNWHVLGWAQRP